MVDNTNSIPTRAELERLSRGQVTGYAVDVTPDIARVWLLTNTGNRSPRAAHIAALARDIVAGRWRLTHQGIAFSADGRLIDGQHRLQAIIKADRPATLMVFLGIHDDMFGALDRGAVRSVRDEIGMSAAWVDPIGTMVRILLTGETKKVTPTDVREMMDAFNAEQTIMMHTFSSYAPGRSNAPIKAALICRLATSNGGQRKTLLEQWRAFATLDLPAMDRTSGAMLKRLERVRGAAGSVNSDERLAVAFVGWGPDRTLQRIQIDDVSKQIGEMRTIIKARLGR